MARGSRGGRGKFSASTKSYVAGKISGQYRAKGYSRSRSQHIGNAVVGKMGKTFKSGHGSKKSYGKGFKVGYGQTTAPRHRAYSGGISRSRGSGIQESHSEGESQSIAQSQRYEKRYSSNKSYGKDYGKHYK